MATRAACGYDLPSTSTLGSHAHHSSSGTPDRAAGMCLPQPRHDFFAVTPARGGQCQRGLRGFIDRMVVSVSLQQSGHVALIHILTGRSGVLLCGLVVIFTVNYFGLGVLRSLNVVRKTEEVGLEGF